MRGSGQAPPTKENKFRVRSQLYAMVAWTSDFTSVLDKSFSIKVMYAGNYGIHCLTFRIMQHIHNEYRDCDCDCNCHCE